jgi:hypothetical protein
MQEPLRGAAGPRQTGEGARGQEAHGGKAKPARHILDRVEPIVEKQPFGGDSRLLCGTFVMAWSPFQRANAGISGVEQPGDYANPIPTTSATGPSLQLPLS